MQMQNEHGGDNQQPEPGRFWFASGSEHDSEPAAASAADSDVPGPADPRDAAGSGGAGSAADTIPGIPAGIPPGTPPGYRPAGAYGPPHPGYGTPYGAPGGYPAQPGGYPSQPGQPGQPPPGGYGQAAGQAQAGDYEQPGPAGGYGQPGYWQAGAPGGGYPGQPGGPGGYPGQPGAPGGGYPGMPGDYLQQPPPPRRRMTGMVAYLAVAAVAAAAGAGTVLLANHASNQATAPPASAPSNPFGGNGASGGFGGTPNQSPNSNVSNSTEQSVISAVRPGLVDITSSLQYQGGTAAGTGMVISSNGLVLTNNHVIEDSTSLSGKIVATGQTFHARFLGYDKTDDVAVIKLVGATGLKTVPLGSSSSVKVGDGVVALGNAGGRGTIISVTGEITGLNQSITASDDGADNSEHLTGMLRTSANVQPGDSGGALASTAGKVIGMDTAAATGQFGNGDQSDVGFAIPISRALGIAQQIIKGQASTTVTIGGTGFLGVLVPGHDAGAVASPAQQLQMQIRDEQSGGGIGGGGSGFGTPPKSGVGCLQNNINAGIPAHVAPVSAGALVIGALCGTPAANFGVNPGDVITSVNGQAVTTPNSLTGIMTALHPGGKVKVNWVTTSGAKESATMTLLTAPPA
jgi:S1-C subfamily serine protease